MVLIIFKSNLEYIFYHFFDILLGDNHQYRGVYPSESPSIPRANKSNLDPPVTNVSHPSSPQTIRHSSNTPQPSSLINPFQSQQVEADPPKNDEIAVGTLLDIMGDDSNQPPPPPPSSTFNTGENELFNLHLEPQSTFPTSTNDLLGVDFPSMSLDKPILHRNASETVLPVPLQATTNILKSESKSSSNQNINRLDPFGDLFSSSSSSSTTQKASSNDSLAAKQQAAGK